MSSVVDLSEDSEGIAEVVDVTVDDSEEDDIHEVQTGSLGGPPKQFHGYRRGHELGRGASGKVFVCTKKNNPQGFAVKAVSLKRLRMSVNMEREHKKLQR